jgi:anthranilate/para-aminobenzoate synthase component II
VTSTSISPVDKKEFVSSIEAKKYPFMATQFHPEKVT